MPKRSSKDLNVNAFNTVRRFTEEAIPPASPQSVAVTALLNDDLRKQVMQEMGRRGGLKGGKARAASLSKKERSQIAKKAAKARWGESPKNDRQGAGA